MITLLAVMVSMAFAGCPPVGTRRVLQSPNVDDRVVVWRDRADLHRYQETSEAQIPPEAAFVVHPLTQAVVVQCPRGDRHAIGIKLTQGPYVGQYGWVDAGDVR